MSRRREELSTAERPRSLQGNQSQGSPIIYFYDKSLHVLVSMYVQKSCLDQMNFHLLFIIDIQVTDMREIANR